MANSFVLDPATDSVCSTAGGRSPSWSPRSGAGGEFLTVPEAVEIAHRRRASLSPTGGKTYHGVAGEASKGLMDLPIKFHLERDKIYQDALAFRGCREKNRAILDARSVRP